MSDQPSVSGAVAEVTAAPKMIRPDQFEQLLPQHIGAEKFTRWALTIVQRPELMQVAKTPEGQLSIMSALMDCASLGLEPGRTYHLVPFKGVVTGIVDYKGEIQLITNAAACSVVAQLVRKGDTFAMLGANTPPRHEADWFNPESRGEVIGGYAYVDYGGRCSLVVTMSEADFLHHRSVAKTHNVWDEWPEPMRLKTLIHQVRKMVPWSAEVRQP